MARLISDGARATIWMFWAECVAFPLAWYWATRGDARLPLSLGLLLFALGAFLCTYLTPGWQAGDFRLAMIAIGFLAPGFALFRQRTRVALAGPLRAALDDMMR